MSDRRGTHFKQHFQSHALRDAGGVAEAIGMHATGPRPVEPLHRILERVDEVTARYSRLALRNLLRRCRDRIKELEANAR
jgi:hypothetical protein